MARSVTFLQLTPEFGGTKFGPFEAPEIRLGSDPGASDITLPETLGVASQHVKLLRQQDNSYILAPVDRAAPIFHYRAGTARPKQVTAPMAVAPGDSFSLVTPEGPRFVIITESDAKAIQAAAEEAAGPDWLKKVQPNATRLREGLLKEIKRRGFAVVFTSRLGNLYMRTWTMVRTGAIFSPVYIVSGMLMLSGWLFAGGAACSALKLNSSKSGYVEDLSNCRDQLGVAQNASGDLAEPSVPQLTQQVLGGEPNWEISVQDKDLYPAFARALREVYAEPLKYRWVYTRKGSPYTSFKAALDSSGLEDPVVRLLAFASASPTFERQWSLVADSEGKDVCGRGVLDLTYRQAKNLGLTTIQPDALVDATLAASNDIQKQREALDTTLREAGATYEYRDDLITGTGAEVQGGMTCLYVDGEDQRDDLKAIASALRSALGDNVPKADQQYWITARLLRLYTADFRAGEFERIKFSAGMAPSISLSTQDVKVERRNYAIDKAARLMGRAVAVPCLALFDKDQREVPKWFMEAPPKLGSCAILKAYVEYDRL